MGSLLWLARAAHGAHPAALSSPQPALLPQVTLIDQGDRFVFKPLLYELLSGAASEEEVAPTFQQLLGPYPVTFLQGRVASVQPQDATQVGEFVVGRLGARVQPPGGASTGARPAASPHPTPPRSALRRTAAAPAAAW